MACTGEEAEKKPAVTANYAPTANTLNLQKKMNVVCGSFDRQSIDEICGFQLVIVEQLTNIDLRDLVCLLGVYR